MNKRLAIFGVVGVVLAALIYVQFRTWRAFDWHTFGEVTGSLARGRGLRHLLMAIAFIYFTYFLRSVRWKIFLRPVCRAHLGRLLPAQFIGFTGLALLGRPGELIRPYIIARNEGLSFSSQLAVWAVERIFDIGAFALLVSIDVFFLAERARLPHAQQLRQFGIVLLLLVALMAVIAWIISRAGGTLALWIEQRLAPSWPRFARSLAAKIRSFGEGLNTIEDPKAFLQLAGLSLAAWFCIAVAYRSVLHAYPQPELHNMHVPQVLLLMASSIVGSLIQLPAVGGGSQLAVISMLSSREWFAIPRELAVSAGILLWLVTFMSVIPAGLLLARHGRLSLRKLSAESEEKKPAAPAVLPG
jgi:hypothetical protein